MATSGAISGDNVSSFFTKTASTSNPSPKLHSFASLFSQVSVLFNLPTETRSKVQRMAQQRRRLGGILRCRPDLPRTLVQKLFHLRQVRREMSLSCDGDELQRSQLKKGGVIITSLKNIVKNKGLRGMYRGFHQPS